MITPTEVRGMVGPIEVPSREGTHVSVLGHRHVSALGHRGVLALSLIFDKFDCVAKS